VGKGAQRHARQMCFRSTIMAGTWRLSSGRSALPPAYWIWEIGVKRAVDTYHETISTKASSQEHVMTDQPQRLSIRFPVLVNLVSPLIPVALFAVWEAIMVMVAIADPSAIKFTIIPGVFMVMFSLVAWASWKRADDVLDEGNTLLVRRRRLVERIALSDIESVRILRGRNFGVVVRLHRPSAFGSKFRFTPRLFVGPLVYDLKRRIALAHGSSS
jgi:hypothetical protein